MTDFWNHKRALRVDLLSSESFVSLLLWILTLMKCQPDESHHSWFITPAPAAYLLLFLSSLTLQTTLTKHAPPFLTEELSHIFFISLSYYHQHTSTSGRPTSSWRSPTLFWACFILKLYLYIYNHLQIEDCGYLKTILKKEQKNLCDIQNHSNDDKVLISTILRSLSISLHLLSNDVHFVSGSQLLKRTSFLTFFFFLNDSIYEIKFKKKKKQSLLVLYWCLHTEPCLSNVTLPTLN